MENLALNKRVESFVLKNLVKKVIYTSTRGVYGLSRELKFEDSAINPINCYSYSKLLGERLLHNASSNVITLRLAQVLSKSERKSGFVKALNEAFEFKAKFILNMNMACFREYISAEAIVEILSELVSVNIAPGIYNCGTGKAYDLKDIAKNVLNGHRASNLEPFDGELLSELTCMNCDKLFTALPSLSLEKIDIYSEYKG